MIAAPADGTGGLGIPAMGKWDWKTEIGGIKYE